MSRLVRRALSIIYDRAIDVYNYLLQENLITPVAQLSKDYLVNTWISLSKFADFRSKSNYISWVIGETHSLS